MNIFDLIVSKTKASTLFATLIMGVTYYLLTISTLSFTEFAGYELIIYPSTGIALGLILLFGKRIWPGILIGCFFGYWWEEGFSPESTEQIPRILYSISVTLQAVLGAWLVRKFNCSLHDFSNPMQNLKFYLIAGPLTSLFDSTIGISISIYFKQSRLETIADDWLLWWIGDVTSVIIFTSLVFCLAMFELRRKIVVSTLLLLTYLVAEGVHNLGHAWDNERLDLIFQQQTAALTDSIENANERYLTILQIMESLRKSPGGTTRQSFKSFADTILPNDPTILTVNWNAHILHEDLEQFDKEVDEEYETDIFVGVTIDSQRIAVQEKDYYVMPKFIEPFDVFYMAVGGDLTVNQMRVDALNHTAEHKTPSMTSPIILNAEQLETIVSMYLASYDGEKLVGYNTVLLSLNQMLDDILTKPFSRDLDLAVTDAEAQDNLDMLFRSRELLDSNPSDYHVDIQMFNRTWTIDLYKKPEFYERHQSSQPFLIGFVAMIISSLVAISVVNMSGRRIFLENLIASRTSELQKANRTKTQFMANMSHDLRTPLNAIIGFSKIIQKEMFGKINNPKYLDYIEDISNSSEYLLTLINDVLDYSLIEAEKREIDKRELNLHEILSYCSKSLYPLSFRKDIDCSTSIQSDMPNLVADDKAVKQILINLISNSIKFTEPGGAIEIKAIFDDNWISISVEDNGEGISEANIRNILTPFTRVENNPHISHEGTGLGLSIVNSLVKLHNAKIFIDSELGQGTKITIKFPRT